MNKSEVITRTNVGARIAEEEREELNRYFQETYLSIMNHMHMSCTGLTGRSSICARAGNSGICRCIYG